VSRSRDHRLLEIRAPTGTAADAFERGLRNLLQAVGDPLAEIEPALNEHPGFVMGHLLRAAVAVLAKDAKALPLLGSELTAARRADLRPTDHERRHLAAGRAWLCGEPELAAERYAAILRDWPRDLLALRLAQSCYFFVGQTAALRDVTDLVAPTWSCGTPGFECFLAMAAFARAENGDSGRAETFGRWAVEIEPRFPFAIHAVAHALHARGDYRGGALWMRRHQGQWQNAGGIVAHNAWHLAQFELAAGAPERALATLDQHLIPAAFLSASSTADATALLWRLQLDGFDPGWRWRVLSNCWKAHSSPGFWPFLDLHAGIAFNAAGSFDRALRLERAVAVCAATDSDRARRARLLTLPGLRAIEAFVAEAYGTASVALGALRPALDQLGASQAQISLFERTRMEAERRCRRSPRLRLSKQAVEA